ncbi:MAG TPA: hypothetical protein ENH84_07755, partial [Phycisphaerae bacterium]|nr:hypothetical protein [Phycisphaerae bacterium]
MRHGLLPSLCLVAVWLLVGCTSSDENPDWDPQSEYPYWAYSAPIYYQPTEELKPQGKVGDNIPIYYPRDEMFFVPHPQGQQKDLHPYIAVWYSHDGGQCWKKAGYFGLSQTHFLFAADFDGQYWIRFVGPGQGVSEVPPGQPHRVYVVDTEAPRIYLTVTPGPWDDKQKTIPHIYNVGDTVTVAWTVNDMNLEKDSIRLSTCFAKFPHNLVWKRFKEKLPSASSMQITIPPEAAHQAGMRFRIVADDKAENIGIGMSEIMHVSFEPPQKQPPDTAPSSPVKGPPSAAKQREGSSGKTPAAALRPGEIVPPSTRTQSVRPNGPMDLTDLPKMFANGNNRRIPRTSKMMSPAHRATDTRPTETRKGPKPPAELLAPISVQKRPQKVVVPKLKNPGGAPIEPAPIEPAPAKPVEKPEAPAKVAVKPVEQPETPAKVAVKPVVKLEAPAKVAVKPVVKPEAPVPKTAVKPVVKLKAPVPKT